MFSKVILAGIFGTSLVGGGAVSGIAPTGLELAAGPVRIESGNGKIVSAKLTSHSPFALTIKLKGDQRLHIKF